MGILSPAQLYFGNAIGANVYTCSNASASNYAIIKNISFCSPNTNSQVSVHILNPSGSATNNNAILSNVTIIADQTVTYDSSIVLEPGQTVYIAGSNGSAFTTLISGVEYSA